LAPLFKPFGVFSPTVLHYLAFQPFDLERPW
jgi:hypothetical protein